MKKNFFVTCFFACTFYFSHAQVIVIDSLNTKYSVANPYRIHLVKDLTIGAGSIAMILAGQAIGNNKTPFDSNDPSNSNTEGIPTFDVSATKNCNEEFLEASNVLLYSSLALPFLSFVDRRVNGHATTIIALYLQTIALSEGLHSMTTGLISRRRPLTYSMFCYEQLPQNKRKNVLDSFYSGHTSMAAATTFFGAAVFTQFRPHSRLLPFVWTAAALMPAFTGYARYEAGKHFLTDVISGYLIGASTGLLIPVLHKIPDNHLALYPTHNGLTMVYGF